MLIAIVAGTPMKTELTFDSLADCLRTETEMRRQWADVFNDAVKRNAGKDTLEMVKRQMGSGTCIPAASK